MTKLEIALKTRGIPNLSPLKPERVPLKLRIQHPKGIILKSSKREINLQKGPKGALHFQWRT